jgi:dTMP kinase
MVSERGRFITIEGVEGAGKSTVIDAVRGHLAARRCSVIVTREPGGTEMGESLRDLLLQPRESGSLVADAELLMMMAARAQHIADVIEPALARGDWVVCDRFTDATYAYQGFGRGLDADWIAMLERRVQGELLPDLTLLLDVPVEQGRQRALGRGETDRFERETNSFFERVRAGYEQRCHQAPARIQPIDASRDPEAVASDVIARIEALVNDGNR